MIIINSYYIGIPKFTQEITLIENILYLYEIFNLISVDNHRNGCIIYNIYS